jgi:hypothetical protein
MDVFLVKGGVIENIISVPSIEWASSAYPDYTIIQRMESNAYHADGTPKNIGDTV